MVEIRRRGRHVAGPLLAAALVAYFGYHAVEGERGLIALWHVTQQLDDANAVFDEIHAQRTVLEHRVALLRPEHLDPGRLDERARAVLDLVGPNEVVILTPKGSADAPAP